jgi:hypothetical protein
MKKLLPLLMLLLGTGAGVGAGVFLRPDPAPSDEAGADAAEHEAGAEKSSHDDGDAHGDPSTGSGKEYVKLSNQFVVPLVDRDRIASMVVMTLSVEAPAGQSDAVFAIEPKIRDAFLRVLFDHAAIGGFRGAFLNNENLDIIRRNLVSAARTQLGTDLISDVLIFEIARQDY